MTHHFLQTLSELLAAPHLRASRIVYYTCPQTVRNSAAIALQQHSNSTAIALQ